MNKMGKAWEGGSTSGVGAPVNKCKKTFPQSGSGSPRIFRQQWELKVTMEGNTSRTPANPHEAMVPAAPVTTPSLAGWKLPLYPLFSKLQDAVRIIGNGLTSPGEGTLNDKLLRRERCAS